MRQVIVALTLIRQLRLSRCIEVCDSWWDLRLCLVMACSKIAINECFTGCAITHVTGWVGRLGLLRGECMAFKWGWFWSPRLKVLGPQVRRLTLFGVAVQQRACLLSVLQEAGQLHPGSCFRGLQHRSVALELNVAESWKASSLPEAPERQISHQGFENYSIRWLFNIVQIT